MQMINVDVNFNHEELREIFLKELRKAKGEAEKGMLFWDTKELVRQTNLSFSTIQRTFFFNSDFPKYKVGGKWMFPAEKTKNYLLDWLERQPKY